MEMSFFVMPLAQTWLARATFKATTTILLANQESAHVTSRLPIPSRSRDGEGRPHKSTGLAPIIGARQMKMLPQNVVDISLAKRQYIR
jgi:hypothetical protein